MGRPARRDALDGGQPLVIRSPKRFHLRTAMLLIVVFAVVLAGIVRPFFAQSQAVAHLSGRGFDLQTEPSWLSRLTRQAVFDRVVGASPPAGSSAITVEDARSLESLPYLQNLSLVGTTDNQLFLLWGLTRLKRIEFFADTRSTEPGLIRLLEHLSALESLSILPDEQPLRLSDAGLAALAKLPRFRNLEVYDYHNVSDAGLAHLKGMNGIEQLDLSDEPITDAGLTHLSGLRTLRSLSVSNSPVTDAGLARLRGLNRLENLSLPQTKVTDAGLAHLRGLPLARLDLNWTQVGDAGLAHLRGMNSLVALHVARTRVTDAGLVHLKGLPQLRGLSLNATEVTDAGLAELSGMKSLANLYLYRTKVSDTGLAHLRGLPKLQSLDLRETQVTDDGVKALREARPKLSVRR
jgi:Leucine-rich repeat (LRR) protein